MESDYNRAISDVLVLLNDFGWVLPFYLDERLNHVTDDTAQEVVAQVTRAVERMKK